MFFIDLCGYDGYRMNRRDARELILVVRISPVGSAWMGCRTAKIQSDRRVDALGGW